MNLDFLNSPIWNFSIWNALQGVGGILTFFAIVLMWWQLKEQQKVKQKPRMQEMYDVVIGPLIVKLERIKENFKNKEIDLSLLIWSFKIAPMFRRGLEEIIFKDFIKLYPEINKKLAEFDQLVEKLINAWKNFEEKINTIPEFRQKVDEKWKEYGQPIEVNPPQYNWIIAWIINEKEELREGHGYYKFWSRYNKDFLIFRNDERVKSEKEKFDVNRKKLFSLTEKILNELKEIANELSRKYGIKIHSQKEI